MHPAPHLERGVDEITATVCAGIVEQKRHRAKFPFHKVRNCRPLRGLGDVERNCQDGSPPSNSSASARRIRSTSMSASATFAPAETRVRAMPRPMPDARCSSGNERRFAHGPIPIHSNKIRLFDLSMRPNGNASPRCSCCRITAVRRFGCHTGERRDGFGANRRERVPHRRGPPRFKPSRSGPACFISPRRFHRRTPPTWRSMSRRRSVLNCGTK